MIWVRSLGFARSSMVTVRFRLSPFARICFCSAGPHDPSALSQAGRVDCQLAWRCLVAAGSMAVSSTPWPRCLPACRCECTLWQTQPLLRSGYASGYERLSLLEIFAIIQGLSAGVPRPAPSQTHDRKHRQDSERHRRDEFNGRRQAIVVALARRLTRPGASEPDRGERPNMAASCRPRALVLARLPQQPLRERSPLL
jgi:hypothetical protein